METYGCVRRSRGGVERKNIPLEKTRAREEAILANEEVLVVVNETIFYAFGWGLDFLSPSGGAPNTSTQISFCRTPSNLDAASTMLSTHLPGQPINFPPKAPHPQIGTGVYERDGQIRASLLGAPRLEGTVRHLIRPS
jgi:hypothetical protein